MAKVSWFVSIHLAVPLIYFLRVSEVLAYWTIPTFVAAALLGQLSGGSLIKKYFNTQSYNTGGNNMSTIYTLHENLTLITLLFVL